ncbi:MAG: hypothetical protein KI790_06955 [Cyclobacteriaceae bacterium]|nr:hypothetical protein [Cyclobacteriaceae bacterium HetDA_MAG_MS6]
MKELVLIGYSGHSFVAYDIALAMGLSPTCYCDIEKKDYNPMKLRYLGSERDIDIGTKLLNHIYFVSIGDNYRRQEVSAVFNDILGDQICLQHPSAVISATAKIGLGVMISINASVNAFAEVGDGVICNTASVLEHGCKVGSFAHIGPGAVLCGDVNIGSMSLVGANAVIKPGITVGTNVIIGSGAVVGRNIPDNTKITGIS